jgi:hypothetical protein
LIPNYPCFAGVLAAISAAESDIICSQGMVSFALSERISGGAKDADGAGMSMMTDISVRSTGVLLSLLLCACGVGSLRADDRLQFFEQKIRPVLVQSCYQCHSAEAVELQGGLRLDVRSGWQQGGVIRVSPRLLRGIRVPVLYCWRCSMSVVSRRCRLSSRGYQPVCCPILLSGFGMALWILVMAPSRCVIVRWSGNLSISVGLTGGV